MALTPDQEAVLAEIADKELAARQASAQVVTDAEGSATILGLNTDGTATVRYVVNGEIVDENIQLPDIPPGVPTTPEMYQAILQPVADARATQLAGQAKGGPVQAQGLVG